MNTLNPTTIAPPLANYSHGIEVPAGWRLIRTSGQLGMEPDGTIAANTQEQAQRCFANIDAILAQGGMDRKNICHLSAFVTDRSHMQGYMVARDIYLAEIANPPASTLVIVSGFTRPEFTVEIEVMACAP